MKHIFDFSPQTAKPVPPVALVEAQGGDSADDPIRRADYDRLIAALDRSLRHFASSTSKASHAAAEYHATLAETAESLEQTHHSPDLAGLTALTRAMLERARQIDAEMHRCEEEAASLREHLDHAQRDARIDHLTGLANRHAFETVLTREYRAARATIDPLCVAFCDIDQFKLVNEAHGHDAGDRVIQAVAKVLTRIAGENCHLARHGGEEFVLLFRGITLSQARDRLDEAREEFARRKLINRETDIPIGTVTFSGGVADVFAYADPRAAMQAADQALRQAKAQGRNRIVVAQSHCVAGAARDLPMVAQVTRAAGHFSRESRILRQA